MCSAVCGLTYLNRCDKPYSKSLSSKAVHTRLFLALREASVIDSFHHCLSFKMPRDLQVRKFMFHVQSYVEPHMKSLEERGWGNEREEKEEDDKLEFTLPRNDTHGRCRVRKV